MTQIRSHTTALCKQEIPRPAPLDGRSRVVIEKVEPHIDGGEFPIKRVIGDIVVVEADVFADGHDAVAAALLFRADSDAEWKRIPMRPLGSDRWTAEFTVEQLGDYSYTVAGWIDHFQTWKRDLQKRIKAGQDIGIDLLIGADLIRRAADHANGRDRERLIQFEEQLRADAATHQTSAVINDEELTMLVSRWWPEGSVTSCAPRFSVAVDRPRASFSAWYEMFPRSATSDARHGTLKDVEARLPYVAAMGFDVLYLPPIHPIGHSHRKGRNNAPTANEHDVGSPWGIGSQEGGHKSIHPQLGTMDDFRRLLAAAQQHGIELALDVAFQTSPDHPYVREHPEWFRKRPDGSIQYAENPPKKYQDIYPFDFETESWQSLWDELRSIFLFWIGEGVRIFRVDNPHTKPFAFWEWAIAEIRRDHPDVILLAEAFTRPKVMYRLAKVGFTQSYTYFAWRDTKWEIIEYFTELTRSEVREFFRPNLWPNTPDILPDSLQVGGRPAFMSRLVLAATLAGNYGIYGPPFEHGWSMPAAPGSEEYLHSEKYQVHHHDINRPDSLKDFIARVNAIRRGSPAIAHRGTLDFHDADNDHIICYSRTSPDGSDIVLVIVSLDSNHRQSAWIKLPLDAMGLPANRPYQMHDLLTDARYLWHGNRNYVELDPATCPAHIFASAAGRDPNEILSITCNDSNRQERKERNDSQKNLMPSLANLASLAVSSVSLEAFSKVTGDRLLENDMATVDLETHKAIAPAPTKAAADEIALWYKDAIIYQLHVRAFRDSNNDGVGDFRGLTEKLDYIQDLGVTAIWLLPFFPSPLRDDGYDIADYTNINPQYGMLDDFQLFLDEAHRRELRVITELVMNHTSDQHMWFQRSRRSPPGSPWRDWYVWSDTPEKYKEARIIFQDFESSNWSWDPVAGAYFWHRFYSHQPDLNFDNPEVCEAMVAALDFWLDRGVDGLRLDAVPYLFEHEGTNCENLPETHAFLKELRAHIDDKYGDRMLLAEANQWPEDAAAYFGDGDECHMNFHFPLMPRLFMAVEREDRTPIIDILEQTPLLPPPCQWAIFLRNHDELTLEMVTDEERDYMYRTYAVDLKARINLGIRRRLAPLLSNNRRKIELMNALLLSLPGTPILYYGDEIGMGDNFHLGDRNGVRTPMHWNGDRNAGFSRANPQSLYLPVIIDPEYHYEFRNVEVQHGNSHSLLWWMRRILDLRKQYHTFGHGSFDVVPSSNAKVFAFLRETDQESILVVANLSRFPQFVDLDLSQFRGRTPMEMFGRSSFPAIDDRPYRVSLGPHGFFWLCLGCRDSDKVELSPADLPKCRVRHCWDDLLKGRGLKALREALEPYLRRHRWFAGKARTLTSADLIDIFDVNSSGAQEGARLMLVNAAYADGEPDAYALPVMLMDERDAEDLLLEHPEGGILRVEQHELDRSFILAEATWNQDFWQELVAAMAGKRALVGRHGALMGTRTNAFSQMWDDATLETVPTIHGGEQSNTSARFDERFILKLFRRLTPGVNPDFEIGRKLTEQSDFAHAPKVAAALEYRDEAKRQFTVAILHEYIPNVGDAWTYTLDELSRYLERVQSTTPETALLETAAAACPLPSATTTPSAIATQAPPVHPELTFPRSLQEIMSLEPHPLAQDTIGAYLHSAALLARRTAELHVTLSKFDEDPAFAPEPFTRLYQRGLYQSMRTQARTTIELLRSQFQGLDEEARDQAARVIDQERAIFTRFSELLHDRIDARRTRCHGDYHLGQVLFTGKDFVIIDFEGEPDRPVSERRIKTSPLRDVAGMMRSFHYASHGALRGHTPSMVVENVAIPVETWVNFWYAWCSASFLQSYLTAAQAGKFLPADSAQLRTLLSAYLLEKALYELRYELNNRPNWVKIPLEGILQLLD